MEITDLLKKLDEALDRKLFELEYVKSILDDKFLTLTARLDDVIDTWDEEKQTSYIDRVIEILEDASRNLDNVTKRIIKSQQPTEEPIETRETTEEYKVLKEIIDLGFEDSTGPKQKEAGIIMLKGTKTSRGYRIEPQGEQFIATQLNNYAINTRTPGYRVTPNKLVGSKLECLNWVLQNATEHLKRMKQL